MQQSAELGYAPRHSLRSCPRRDLIGSAAAERYPLGAIQTLVLIPVVVILGFVRVYPMSTCSVAELRDSPDYTYRVERIRQFVDSAPIIVRARAEVELAAGPSSPLGAAEPRVRFRILERIRAPDSLHHIDLRASVVGHDDFNRGGVPYTIVRPAGQRGDCHAREYRLGAEYLLILAPRVGELSPHWKPLAPFNEQVRGADDPWVNWVRQTAARTGDGNGA